MGNTKLVKTGQKLTNKDLFCPDTAAKNLFRWAKRRALERDTVFNLELSDIDVPWVCPALGRLFTRTGIYAPTLDRLIPTLGYVPGNVYVISKRANRIKSDATPKEILKVGAWYLEEMENRH